MARRQETDGQGAGRKLVPKRSHEPRRRRRKEEKKKYKLNASKGCEEVAGRQEVGVSNESEREER